MNTELEEGRVEVLNIKGIIGFDGKYLNFNVFIHLY